MRAGDHELPVEKQRDLRTAQRLAWITIAYLCSDIFFMYLVMGNSQAMLASIVEDGLNLLPPIGFLLAARIRTWEPNERYPYGYHRAMEIAFLSASLAIVFFGAFVLYDSVAQLIRAEHTTIGTIELFGLFGQPIWQGWIMLLVLGYSIPVALYLGSKKLPLSRSLNVKALYAGAKMNKADWMTTSAAMAGIMGIGFGIWWTDAAAAALIALDILYDGYKNTKAAVGDLLERVPEGVDESEPDPLPERVAHMLRDLDWIDDAQVRVREVGSIFFGEAFVVPVSEKDIVERVNDAVKAAYDLDWRLHDLVIHLVPTLEGDPGPIDTRYGRGQPSSTS